MTSNTFSVLAISVAKLLRCCLCAGALFRGRLNTFSLIHIRKRKYTCIFIPQVAFQSIKSCNISTIFCLYMFYSNELYTRHSQITYVCSRRLSSPAPPPHPAGGLVLPSMDPPTHPTGWWGRLVLSHCATFLTERHCRGWGGGQGRLDHLFLYIKAQTILDLLCGRIFSITIQLY